MTSEAIAAQLDGQQLFAIVETKIEKYPYAEENDEYMPDQVSIHKTVVGKINNRQTVRQNWEEQMHQLNMAGHLLLSPVSLRRGTLRKHK